ncbi:MAG: hypothetical protein IJT27_03975 [Clostridia bacterium]|nr:hypothetical protein [Clostridia bacterium]
MTKLHTLLKKLRKDKKIMLPALAGVAGLLLLLASGAQTSEKTLAADDYFALRTRTEEALEKKAEKLLSTVAGVGKVRVVVTLESLEETVYAKDGETRGDSESDQHVVLKQSGSEYGLSERVVMPTVRGVAVSCEGAASAAIRQEVCSLLCAAFGVSANRVYISRMAE